MAPCKIHRAVHRHLDQRWPARRCGFTILELIVTTGIIGLLVALLLPAVQQARSAARRTRCANHLRNVAFAMLQEVDTRGRFPACGNFGKDGNHHGWVVDLLPWLEARPLADKWDKDKPITDPINEPLTDTQIPVIVCPDDISAVGGGDLSYAVNGGIGFTVKYAGVTHDCPVDPSGRRLDLNGNGVMCPDDDEADGEPSDRDLFFRTGLFFNETWKWDITVRHHRYATVVDGMTQTLMLAENVRTGRDPARATGNWATNNPYLTSFYIGNPCLDARCSSGRVDYGRTNAGAHAINSGLASPEGSSPVPNSFHTGGVNVAFCDGRVQFLQQGIDGSVYAALVSPQGSLLGDTPLAQQVLSDFDF